MISAPTNPRRFRSENALIAYAVRCWGRKRPKGRPTVDALLSEYVGTAASDKLEALRDAAYQERLRQFQSERRSLQIRLQAERASWEQYDVEYKRGTRLLRVQHDVGLNPPLMSLRGVDPRLLARASAEQREWVRLARRVADAREAKKAA